MSDFARLMELARETTPAPVNTEVPAVTPLTAAVGETLSCTHGTWDGEPTSYNFHWRNDGVDIGGGSPTYQVAETDAGHAIDCVVSAANLGGQTDAPPSNSVTIS